VRFATVDSLVRFTVWTQAPFDGFDEPERYTPLFLSRPAAYGTLDTVLSHFSVFFGNGRIVHNGTCPADWALDASNHRFMYMIQLFRPTVQARLSGICASMRRSCQGQRGGHLVFTDTWPWAPASIRTLFSPFLLPFALCSARFGLGA